MHATSASPHQRSPTCLSTISLVLPYPPSSNVYWRNWRGRMVVSGEARAYRNAVGLECRSKNVTPLDGTVRLVLHVYRPRKAGDLSNRIKVVEDALQGYAFNNDSQVVAIVATRATDKHNPRVEVHVDPASDPDL